jgi:hypothetical protein
VTVIFGTHRNEARGVGYFLIIAKQTKAIYAGLV